MCNKQFNFRKCNICCVTFLNYTIFSVNLCREVLDGIRIYFDFTLNDILLYNSEKGQIVTAPIRMDSSFVKSENSNKMDLDDQEYAHLPIVDDDDSLQNDIDLNMSHGRSTRRRTLR